MISWNGSLILLSLRKVSQILLNTSCWRAMSHVLEELEKPTTLELPESQAPKSSTDQNKFKNPMSEPNVDYSISERSVMTTFHISLNARTQLPALSFWEEPQRMFLTKCKEIFTIVWVFLRISIVSQDSFLEEVQLKCKSVQESMRKEVNIQASNNCHSKQVILFIYFSWLRIVDHS